MKRWKIYAMQMIIKREERGRHSIRSIFEFHLLIFHHLNSTRESVEEISYFPASNPCGFWNPRVWRLWNNIRNSEWVSAVSRVTYTEWLSHVPFWNRAPYRAVQFECCNNTSELFHFVGYFVVVLIFNIGEIEHVPVLIGRGNSRIRFGRHMPE